MVREVIIHGSPGQKRSLINVIEKEMGYTPTVFSCRKALIAPGSTYPIVITTKRRAEYSRVGSSGVDAIVFQLPEQRREALKACQDALKNLEPYHTEEGFTITLSNLKVGDKVRVVHEYMTYETYASMFQYLGFTNSITSNRCADIENIKERIATVVHMNLHFEHDDKYPLIAIRYDDGKELLIMEEGLDKVN